MPIHTVVAPWAVPLSTTQHTLIYYALVVAGLGFIAALLRTIATRGEVGPRYRTAVAARLGVMGIALASYLLLLLQFEQAYRFVGGMWQPTDTAMLALTSRYMEWSVSVPLLTIELLAVCTLVGPVARRTRVYAVSGAFLMIFTGYLGAVIIGGGESEFQRIIWGAVSCVFWIATTVVLVNAVRKSMPGLTAEAGALLKSATLFLLSGWALYPVVYLLQILVSGGEWTTVQQISFTIADLTVKVGFAGLVHRVAKLRTAEDVRAGVDVHPESIWISSVKQSDAGLPVIVYLAPGASIHQGRPKPAGAAAIAAEQEPQHRDESESQAPYSVDRDADYE